MKRTKLKKKSPKKISVLKRRLWKVFSLYIRRRDKGICYTCNRKCEGSGYHAGHFIQKSVGGIILYFNEDNVRGQCYNCNINLSGNQYEFAKRLGLDKAEELLKLKQIISKWSEEDYNVKIEYYKNKTQNK